MTNILPELFDMSVAAGWLVLAVLIVRTLLKKAPRALVCALWALVGIRLVCPFSFESALSLIPRTEPVTISAASSRLPVVSTTVETPPQVVDIYYESGIAPSIHPDGVMAVLGVLWLVGVFAMLAYMLISYICLRVRVREAAFLRDNIYECDSINTPFILGVFRPKIYLPSAMNEGDSELVIAHETAHLRRLDHIWKPLGFFILALHWFNPLIWLAYVLLCRDIEFACDEKVIKQLGADIKKSYSEALINCSVPRKTISACPLAFGEVGVKARIKNVLNYKKPAFWIIIVALVLLTAVAVCFLTDPIGFNTDLDDYISSVILEQNAHDKQDGYASFEAHTIFGTRRRGNEIKLYTMVYQTDYMLDGQGELAEKINGSHIPTVITVRKTGGKYELVGYDQPRDGTYYPKDIKKLFPWYLRPLTDTQLYIKQHRSAFEQHAGVDLDRYYDGLYDKIVAENKYPETTTSAVEDNSSKPITFVDGECQEYVYHGSPDPLAPTIKLSTDDNTFSFVYSAFSSYFPIGYYEITEEGLTLDAYMGDFTYFFEAVEGGWRLVAAKSSAIPSYRYSGNSQVSECPVPDGAVFELITQPQ